jgi:hypothetical protein
MASKDGEDLIKLTFSHEVNRAAPLQERYGGVKPPQAIIPIGEDLIEKMRDLPKRFQAVTNLRRGGVLLFPIAKQHPTGDVQGGGQVSIVQAEGFVRVLYGLSSRFSFKAIDSGNSHDHSPVFEYLVF